MRTASAITIDELIYIGKTVNLTYYKTSIHQLVEYIECSARNIYHEYLDYLKNISVNVELSDNEFHKYAYRPKILAYDLYKSTDLFFILMMLNNVNNEKDFIFRNLRVLRPDDIDVLTTIYNNEKKYLLVANTDDIEDKQDYSGDSTLPNFMSSGIGGIDPDEQLIDIKNEIHNIKQIIRDLIGEAIGDDINEIIEGMISDEIENIRNMIDQYVDLKIAEKIENLLQLIEEISIDINNRIDLEIDDIYEEFYKIRNEIANIVIGGGNEGYYEDLLNRLNVLESIINDIDDLIEGIVDQKISDRLQILMERLGNLELISPSDVVNEILLLKEQISELEEQIGSLSSDTYEELVNKLKEDFIIFKDEILNIVGPNLENELYKLEGIIHEIANRTRDIVFKFAYPVGKGIHEDSEFLIPYDGVIKKAIFGIGKDSIMTSNIIIKLERYDDTIFRWIEVKEFIVHAGNFLTEIDTNININKNSVRFVVEEGDLSEITNLSVILKLLEDLPEEEEEDDGNNEIED